MGNKKYQIIALMGKAGAGKDSVQNATCKAHPNVFHKIVSCTTRPPREGEEDGVAYHFIGLEDFTRKVLNGEMLEATEFRGWFYGTLISNLVKDKINIGVFNPAGVEALIQDARLDVMIIYIDADDKTRLMRALNREEHPDCVEICRRFLADEHDFNNLSDDIAFSIVQNEDYKSLDLLEIGSNLYSDFSFMWEYLGNPSSFESAAFWGKDKLKKTESTEIEVIVD